MIPGPAIGTLHEYIVQVNGSPLLSNWFRSDVPFGISTVSEPPQLEDQK